MKSHKIVKNRYFVGRETENAKLWQESEIVTKPALLLFTDAGEWEKQN